MRQPISKRPARKPAEKPRTITDPEFQLLLDACEQVVAADAVEGWQTFWRGLWFSGLRLDEALALRWNQVPGGIAVRLDGRASVLVFSAESQKSEAAQTIPLAPEAVELLKPMRRKSGYVFLPDQPRDRMAISRTLHAISRAAGVVVESQSGRVAGARDMRQAFCHRWRHRISEKSLAILMRVPSPAAPSEAAIAELTRELWAAVPSSN
jgi:integrase